MGFTEKSDFFEGGSGEWGGGFTKNQYSGADCLKKWDAWTVCKFKGGLGKKEGLVFEGGWYPNADYVLGGYVLKG